MKHNNSLFTELRKIRHWCVTTGRPEIIKEARNVKLNVTLDSEANVRRFMH